MTLTAGKIGGRRPSRGSGALQAMCLCYLNPPQSAQLCGKRTEYFADKFEGNEERLSRSVGWTSVSERAETCRKKVNDAKRSPWWLPTQKFGSCI
jgi:hypothetical protein